MAKKSIPTHHSGMSESEYKKEKAREQRKLEKEMREEQKAQQQDQKAQKSGEKKETAPKQSGGGGAKRPRPPKSKVKVVEISRREEQRLLKKLLDEKKVRVAKTDGSYGDFQGEYPTLDAYGNAQYNFDQDRYPTTSYRASQGGSGGEGKSVRNVMDELRKPSAAAPMKIKRTLYEYPQLMRGDVYAGTHAASKSTYSAKNFEFSPYSATWGTSASGPRERAPKVEQVAAPSTRAVSKAVSAFINKGN